MWREHAKAKAHIYAIYVNFWEIIIAFPNGAQWAPFSKVCPLAQSSSYATDCVAIICKTTGGTVQIWACVSPYDHSA